MDFGPVGGGKRTSPEVAWFGSIDVDEKSDRSAVNLKRGRSGAVEDAWKGLRVSEVDFSSGKGGDNFAAFGGSSLVDDRQKMLSFSSSSSTAAGIAGSDSGRNIGFSVHGRSAVGGSGASNVMQGPFARPKGPFTPSQWMELEHQALIYKHLVANVPVPSNLLLPLKRSLYSYGSTGSYASNFLGWGPFHLGYSSNDPEPGRCRRTDGKKWRCSREAVPDQKYCERHINRGRHRSRKPVEGRTGHAVSGSTASKVAPIASSSSASVMSSASAPNSLSPMQQQYNLLQPCADIYNSKLLQSRSQGFQGLSLTPPTTDLKSKEATCSVQKLNTTLEESANSEFPLGFSSDSLLNGSNSGSLLQLYSNEPEGNNNPVPHFTDDWPKYQSVLNSDWTQLSMSIPMARDLSPSTLKLSHEAYPVQKQSNSWLPVMWGNSVGGPLGEALTSKATVGESYLSMKALKSSPQMGSSPTGVLQKPSTFIALSNSSYGSSPISGENKKVPENPGPCDDLLSSATAAIPSQ